MWAIAHRLAHRGGDGVEEDAGELGAIAVHLAELGALPPSRRGEGRCSAQRLQQSTCVSPGSISPLTTLESVEGAQVGSSFVKIDRTALIRP